MKARLTRRRRFAAGALVAAGCVGLGLPLLAQDATTGAKVQEVLARMDQAQGDAVWDQAQALERLGAGAPAVIAGRLDAARGATKVAAAKAVLAMDGSADADKAAAIRALKDVVRAEGGARDLRVRSCDLLNRYGSQADVQAMVRDLEQVRDPFVKVALLKTLRIRGRHRPAERQLQELLASEDASLQSEAALALAEVGNVEAAKTILNQLKNEPTERGRRAAAFLDQEKLLAQLERFGGLENTDDLVKMRDNQIKALQAQVEQLQAQARSGLPAPGTPGAAPGTPGAGEIPGQALFRELFQRIRDQYVDEKKTDTQSLIDHAASGLVDSLDPFSSYMNEKDMNEFNSQIRQQYGGIGAVVQMDRKTGFLTIQRPIYGNPAHKAGLRTLDQITEVEGQSTKGKTVEQLVLILKGAPGTPVRIKVKPFLGGEEHELSVTRDQITMSSTRYELLPGQIGYVQLAQFGGFATQEIEEALKALEARGMKGLILDLRGNPGGLLSAAVEIADKFLDDDKLVVYSEGRKGTRFGARQEDGGPSVAPRRRLQPKHPDYPVAVLVDEHSASASEIVSGALQAHNRAVLVGHQTFGKGSVQNVFPLESVGERAALRMTIAHYFLPDGRCIHRERDPETWKFVERMRMEIERWKQEGIINETEATTLMKDYDQPPGGVDVDYKVEPLILSAEKQKAFSTILDLQLVEDYIQANWAANHDAFRATTQSDGFDPSRYPKFDELWATVQSKLDDASKAAIDKNDLRMLVRSYVRRFVQDDEARVLTSDYQEDRQLQAALLVMTQSTGQSIEAIPELSFVKKLFPEGVARTREPTKLGAPAPGGTAERDF